MLDQDHSDTTAEMDIDDCSSSHVEHHYPSRLGNLTQMKFDRAVHSKKQSLRHLVLLANALSNPPSPTSSPSSSICSERYAEDEVNYAVLRKQQEQAWFDNLFDDLSNAMPDDDRYLDAEADLHTVFPEGPIDNEPQPTESCDYPSFDLVMPSPPAADDVPSLTPDHSDPDIDMELGPLEALPPLFPIRRQEGIWAKQEAFNQILPATCDRTSQTRLGRIINATN